MARIPEAEIERLKEGVPVQRLVEASGIDLKKGGKDLLGRCPFHQDDTASLVVTPAKNLWHCSSCGIGGGPIDWVIKRNGVSSRHAVELLRADVGLAADAEPGARRRARLPAPVTLDVVAHGQGFGLLLQLVQPLGQLAVRGGQLAQPHKSSHHVDRYLDRPRAVEDGGGHQRAMLGEHPRRIAPAATSGALVV